MPLLVSLISLTGQVSVGNLEHVELGVIASSNMPENARSAALTGIMIGLSSTFVIAMWVLTIFYTLDSLYAERKDRSILFWRSTPATDSETVISKLLTAIVVIPLTTFALIAITHIVVLTTTSFWLAARGGGFVAPNLVGSAIR